MALLIITFSASCHPDGGPDDSGLDTDETGGPDPTGAVNITYTFEGEDVECFTVVDGEKIGTTGAPISGVSAGEHEFSLGELYLGNWVHDLGADGMITAPTFDGVVPEDGTFTASKAGNRFIEGEWTCRAPDLGINETDVVEYLDGHILYLPGLGNIEVSGDDVSYEDDSVVANGSFENPNHLVGTLTARSNQQAYAFACWPGDESDEPS